MCCALQRPTLLTSLRMKPAVQSRAEAPGQCCFAAMMQRSPAETLLTKMKEILRNQTARLCVKQMAQGPLILRRADVSRETIRLDRINFVKMSGFHTICQQTTVAQRLFIHYNRNSASLQDKSGEFGYTFLRLSRRISGRVSWKELKPRAFRGLPPCWLPQ